MEISRQIQLFIENDKNLYNYKYCLGYLIFIFIFLTFGLFFPIKQLSDDQIHYIYSAIPQILGALVGLLLAGYCFSSGLSAAKVRVHFQEDAKQIDKIISAIQKSNLGRFSLLSYFSFACIVISLTCVALSEFHDISAQKGIASYLYTLCNIATALFLISLFLCYRVTEIFLSGKTLDRALNALALDIDKSENAINSPQPGSHAAMNKPLIEEEKEEDALQTTSECLTGLDLINLPKNIESNNLKENIEIIENLSLNLKKLTEFIKIKTDENSSDRDFYKKLYSNGNISKNNYENLNYFSEYIKIFEIGASEKTKIPTTLINMTLRAYRKLKKIASQLD